MSGNERNRRLIVGLFVFIPLTIALLWGTPAPLLMYIAVVYIFS